ncbi:MAG: agmatinase family protein [Tidjanibacter sp.]|nr:agmatinase family protein [Tidjanibacter sp.]
MNATDFNPNGVGIDNGNYFGMPFSEQEAQLVLISVPWDVTSSYGSGSSNAPDAIIEASTQLDFYDIAAPDAWRKGIATAGIDYSIQDRSARYRADAKKVIQLLESGNTLYDNIMQFCLNRVNKGSAELNEEVYNQVKELLAQGKLVGLVGGDHSTPYGAIKAVAEHEQNIGLLHFDAHCDLRCAYEGFIHSHASIMYNVMESIPQVAKLVQVGIRDCCDDEIAYAAANDKVEIFADHTLAANRFEGMTWKQQCDMIVEKLPQKVYISFDIDGLSPENCPSTGTPVPGGLSFNEAVYLMKHVVDSGRRIVGFDMCEVVPHRKTQWDANVGARVLYKLCGQILRSNPDEEK